MTAPIELFFDFASPYAWFALSPLRRLAAAHGRIVNLRPMLLWAVLQQRQMPAPMDNAAKKAYLLHDMDRSARYHGLEFRLPDPFPTSSHLPARLLLQIDDPQRADDFADAILEAYFKRNLDLREPRAIVEVACGVGLDPAWSEQALSSEHGKSLLKQSNAAALDAGVWGSPFILVDGEAYFGSDRIPQIALQLASSARL
jgi:2-hydroxychromene-2-carboxylate isomerase